MTPGSYGSGRYGAKRRKYGYVNYLVTLLVRVFYYDGTNWIELNRAAADI